MTDDIEKKRGPIETGLARTAGFINAAQHWSDAPDLSKRREELRALCWKYVCLTMPGAEELASTTVLEVDGDTLRSFSFDVVERELRERAGPHVDTHIRRTGVSIVALDDVHADSLRAAFEQLKRVM